MERKEAIEVVKKNLPDSSFTMLREALETLIPEFKESEDERIRKEMISWLKGFIGEEEGCGYTEDEIKERIAWLEKQAKQKSDTDFSDLRTWKYIVDAVWTEKEGIGQYLDSPFTEEVAKKLQKRFGNIEQKPANFYCQENCKWFQETGKCFADGGCKAKKEAEQKPVDVRTTGYWHVEDIERKPAWSEEDDTFFKAIIRDIENTQYISEDAKKDRINWLKSLKDRVGCEADCTTTKKWSEEDEAMYQGVIETEQYMLDVVYGRRIFDVGNEGIKEECTKELNWLNSRFKKLLEQFK